MKKLRNNTINYKKYFKVFLPIITAVFCLIFCYWYVHNEDNVYVYDYVGYQLRANYLYQLMSTSIIDGLKYLFETIRISDYNSLPIVITLPFYYVLGIKRTTYIASLVLCYLVPAVTLMFYFIKGKFEEFNNSKKGILLYICVLVYSGFWSATLRGLPDISGTIPFILLLFFVKKYSFSNKNKVIVPVVFGTLAYIPFILRRWYAYGVVSLYFSYFLVNLYDFIKSNNKKQMFKNELYNFGIAGITTLMLLFIFQLPLVKTILKENYANSYQAFQFTLSEHIGSFLNEYGIFILLLIVLGVISIFVRKELRKEKIYILSNIVIFVFLFTRTQGMGVHHFLGISIYMLLMAFYGISYILSIIKKEKIKTIVLSLITLIFMLNFVNTYIVPLNIKYVFQYKRYYKFKYDNYDNLKTMCSDISNLIIDKYGKISVFASTNEMSDSLLDVVCDDTLSYNLIYTSTVDLRDGLNYNSIFNRYVVVTDPVQADLAVDTQNVLTIPNEMIINNKGIGKSYTKVLGPYLLKNNVQAYVYEKTSEISEENINNYLSNFYDKYPAWKNKYNLIEKMLLTSKITLGKYNSEFKRINEKTYFVSPGNEETKIESSFVENLNTFKLKFYTENIPLIDGAGIINIKVKQNKNILYDGIVSVNNPKEILFDSQKGKNLTIEVSYGELFSYDFLYFDIIEVNGEEL